MARRRPHFRGDPDRYDWPLIGYRRGHLLRMFRDGQWRWADNGRFAASRSAPGGDRCCILCGEPATPEGCDACLGPIEGAQAACCGHGLDRGYVLWDDGTNEPTPLVTLDGLVALSSPDGGIES